MMRWLAAVLVVVLGTACQSGDIDWWGARWDANEACWSSEIAFQAPDVAGDLEIWVRDPDGVCWTLSAYPDLPEGWIVLDGVGCPEVPESMWEPTEENLCP